MHIAELLYAMKTEKILKVLSDKNRLRILSMLDKKALCVCEITEVLGIKQPSVSRHLKKLKKAGIIGERKDGLFTEHFLIRKGLWYEIWNKIKKEIENDAAVRMDSKRIEKVDRYRIKNR